MSPAVGAYKPEGAATIQVHDSASIGRPLIGGDICATGRKNGKGAPIS